MFTHNTIKSCTLRSLLIALAGVAIAGPSRATPPRPPAMLVPHDTSVSEQALSGVGASVGGTGVHAQPSGSNSAFDFDLLFAYYYSMGVNSHKYQYQQTTTSQFNQATNAGSQFKQPVAGAYNGFSSANGYNYGLSSYAGGDDLDSLFSTMPGWSQPISGSDIADPDNYPYGGGDDGGNAYTTVNRRASLSSAQAIYATQTRYPDGSILVTYYADSAHQNELGWKAVDRPKWSGSAGQFPVLFQSIYNVKINGVRVRGITAYVINDPQGKTGELAQLLQCSSGLAFTYRYVVQQNWIGQAQLFQVGNRWTSTVAVADQQGAYAYQASNSTGITWTLWINPDTSGGVELQKQGYSVDYLDMFWYADLAGYYRIDGGYWYPFADILDIL